MPLNPARRHFAAAYLPCLLLCGAVGAPLATGCAHTSAEEEERERKARQDSDVMKERVRRLERKVSDLDTKITRLLERAGDIEAPSAVSSGAPGRRRTVYLPSEPGGQAPHQGAPAAYPGSDTPDPSAPTYPSTTYPHSAYSDPGVQGDAEPDRSGAVAVGPGARPIDLPNSTETILLDPEPSEPLTVGDEPENGPILIDKAALARLEARSRGAPREFSKTPNRPVNRDQTRPGPKGNTKHKTSAAASRSGAADTGKNGRKLNQPMPVKSAKSLYGWAMARREEGNIAQAVGAFDELQKRFPKHHLADNANYWAGVCYQSRGAHKDALRVWRRLPVRYPNSPKLPDALFGMAEVHEALGDRQTAIELYTQMLDQYPRAERAREARGALSRLRGG